MMMMMVMMMIIIIMMMTIMMMMMMMMMMMVRVKVKRVMMMMMMATMMMSMRMRMIMIGPEPRTTLCASLRSRNALQQATSYGNLQEKCRGPKPRPTLCASLGSRNACQDFTSHNTEICRKNAAAQSHGRHFVRACTHVKISQEPNFMRNFGPKPRPTLCASLRSRNAWQDFKRATLFFAEIKEKNAASQNHGPQFA